jgi:endo-1,4-beta-xylanase
MPSLLEEVRFAERLTADCRCLTPEVHLKWDAIEPRSGSRSFEGADRIADFARQRGMRMRGHTLLWHRSTPTWADQAIGQSDWAPVARHFAALMPRYGDIVDEWDVVNEPIDAVDGYQGLRRNQFLDAFGPDYIECALWEARAHAPAARLMLNEYGLEYDGPWGDARRTTMLRLVEHLRARGAPLGGIGVQAHLDLTHQAASFASFETFLEHLERLGLRVTITELDVREQDRTLPIGERDRRVAAAASAFLDVALSSPAVTGVVTWGVSDLHSWLQHEEFETSLALASRPVLHDRLNRGLPYDGQLRPKAFGDALTEALARHG